MSAEGTLFEQLGESRLRGILVDFYDRVFADVMIGFLFHGIAKARLVELEYQFTAKHLGADIDYEGRPLRQAHGRHPIMKGHFQRRNVILEDTLRDHQVPEVVHQAWMAHVRGLEAAILGDASGSPHCDHEQQRRRST